MDIFLVFWSVSCQTHIEMNIKWIRMAIQVQITLKLVFIRPRKIAHWADKFPTDALGGNAVNNL